MHTKQYIEEINKYSRQLSKENQEKFDQILLKIRFSTINDHDAEEFSHHCLDLFLQAEKNQTPIEEVLGTRDLDDFCNDFIEETKSGYSYFQKLYWRVNMLPMILFLFTGVFEMLLGYLVRAWIKQDTFLTVPFTLSMLIDTLVVIIITAVMIKKTNYFYRIFNGNDKRKDRLVTFYLWLGSCAITGLFVVSKLFLPQILFTVNYLVFMGVLGTIWFVQHLVENRNE